MLELDCNLVLILQISNNYRSPRVVHANILQNPNPQTLNVILNLWQLSRGFSQVHAYLPAMESFGFETDLRTHTSGQAPRVVAVDFEDDWTQTFRFGLCGWCFFFSGDEAVKKKWTFRIDVWICQRMYCKWGDSFLRHWAGDIDLTIFTSRTFGRNYCYTHTHTSMPSSRLCLSFSCNKHKLSDYYDHEYSCFSLLPWIFSPSLLQAVSRSTMSVYATSPMSFRVAQRFGALFWIALCQAMCQTFFDHWEHVPGDPLDRSILLRLGKSWLVWK